MDSKYSSVENLRKVAIILPYLKVGGTERQAIKIQRSAECFNFDATLVVIEKTGGLLDSAFLGKTIFLNTKFSLWNSPRIIFLLLWLIRKEDFDVILSRAWRSNLFAAFAAMMSGIPSVLYLSGSNVFPRRSFLRMQLEKFIYSKVRKFIAVCDRGIENFRARYEIEEDRLVRVYNGVDTSECHRVNSEYSESERGEVKVCFMGRITERKGLDVLLKALEILKNDASELEKVELHVIGDGDARGDLELFAQDKGLRVFFYGEKKNPFPILQESDIFVLPSRSEGFPNALLEAMSFSLPSIAADCETGPSEIIQDGINGYLFPVEDYRSLAEKIKILAMDRERRLSMGALARETVERSFSAKEQMRKLYEVLSSV